MLLHQRLGCGSIAGYAGRMRARIEGDKPVLLGVSFGGMMAMEIAKAL